MEFQNQDMHDADEGGILDEKTNALRHVVSYFESTWIRRFNARTGRSKCGLYQVEMWNVHLHVLNGFQKTNNVSKGSTLDLILFCRLRTLQFGNLLTTSKSATRS